MSRSRPQGGLTSLPGIHLTLAVWLPPPDAARNWPGWLQKGPREYLVHPDARELLIRTLSEHLAQSGSSTVVHAPEQTDQLAAAAAQRTRQLARQQAQAQSQAPARSPAPAQRKRT